MATETEIQAVTAALMVEFGSTFIGEFYPNSTRKAAKVAAEVLDRVRAEDACASCGCDRAWHEAGGRSHSFVTVVRAEDTRDALRYLIERVDREFKDQDQPPELDFVLMAANEVRHLAEFSGGASAGGENEGHLYQGKIHGHFPSAEGPMP